MTKISPKPRKLLKYPQNLKNEQNISKPKNYQNTPKIQKMTKILFDRELKIKPSPIRPQVSSSQESATQKKVVRDGRPYPYGSSLNEEQGRPLNTQKIPGGGFIYTSLLFKPRVTTLSSQSLWQLQKMKLLILDRYSSCRS